MLNYNLNATVIAKLQSIIDGSKIYLNPITTIDKASKVEYLVTNVDGQNEVIYIKTTDFIKWPFL